MRSLLFPISALVLCAACGSGGSQVCPPSWNDNASSPGGCEAPTSFTAGLGTGVYGFVRTTAHGGNELVVGSDVFALPASATTCDAASVNAVASAVTDQNGIFTMTLPAGSYLVTSGEVPSCIAVTVDANTSSDVALTYP